MLRCSIREMLFITACVGLSLGWWLDHRQKAEAAEDARMLAHFSATTTGMCGFEAARFAELQKKYGAGPYQPLSALIEAYKDEPLGIDFEE